MEVTKSHTTKCLFVFGFETVQQFLSLSTMRGRKLLPPASNNATDSEETCLRSFSYESVSCRVTLVAWLVRHSANTCPSLVPNRSDNCFRFAVLSAMIMFAYSTKASFCAPNVRGVINTGLSDFPIFTLSPVTGLRSTVLQYCHRQYPTADAITSAQARSSGFPQQQRNLTNTISHFCLPYIQK